MFDFLKHGSKVKTVYVKYCTDCYRLLRWKGIYPDMVAVTCCGAYHTLRVEGEYSKNRNVGMRLPRLLL